MKNLCHSSPDQKEYAGNLYQVPDGSKLYVKKAASVFLKAAFFLSMKSDKKIEMARIYYPCLRDYSGTFSSS